MIEGMKVCSVCCEAKPLAQFCIVRKSTGARRTSCNVCQAARIKAYYASNPKYRQSCKQRAAQWAKDNPEKFAKVRRKTDLKFRFGLSPEQYDTMLATQNGRCALCSSQDHGRSGKSGRHDGSRKWASNNWNVDHCHKTGTVRGLLCHKCNVRLGAYEFLMDQIGAEKVSAYLARAQRGQFNVPHAPQSPPPS